MAVDPEEAELRALLGKAEATLARAVAEARLEPGVAAAACATLAGEYGAVLAAGRRLPPGTGRTEAARVLRRRGEAVHRERRPGDGAGKEDSGSDGGGGPTGRVRSPRRRPLHIGQEPHAAEEPHGGPAIPPWLWPLPSFRRWQRFLDLPLRGSGRTS